MQVDTLGYTITIDTTQIQDAMKKFEQAFKETENYMRSTFGPDFEKVWNGITAKITDTGKEIKSNVSINTALQTDLPKAQEMLTNFFERIKQEAEKEGAKVQPRFSPGYGDVSLEVQKQIFTTLRPEKIGLTLMNSLIMAPEKSVTAFVGWKKGK